MAGGRAVPAAPLLMALLLAGGALPRPAISQPQPQAAGAGVAPAGPAAVGVAAAAPAPVPAGVGTLYSPIVSSDLYGLAGDGDPWALLTRAPEVMATRAYATGYGGHPGEAFVGTGSTGGEGIVRIDGFEVGDASSPSLPFGVSALTAQEVAVTTGGADPAVLTPGLQINLVQSRGTNEWRSALRGLGSGGALAGSAPAVRDLAPGQAASEGVSGDRVRDLATGGGELGGPLLRDRLWAWGGVDRAWTALSAFGGQRLDLSDLGGAAKVDARLAAGNSATLAWTHAGRTEDGEGAGPDRAPPATLERQSHDDVWRLADTAILSPSLYAAATGGVVAAATQGVPGGGLATPVVIDAAGVARGSWYADQESSHSSAGGVEVSDSGRLAGIANELRLAGEWRRTAEASRFQTPVWAQVTAGQVLDLPAGQNALDVWRDGNVRDTLTRQGLWAADTLRWSRATADLGLRFDRQTPQNLPSTAPGVPGQPLLPAVDFAGNDAGGIRWNSLAPRLALALAPPAAPRLLLRASLARYASQLDGVIAARLDPAAAASAAFYQPATPGGQGLAFWYPNGFDPALPPGVSPNELDPRLRPELTDEAVVGAEQALGGDGAIGLQLVYRRVTGVLEDRLLVRDAATGEVREATVNDWQPAGVATGTLPNGRPYSVPYFDLQPDLSPTGGTMLTNGDRQQRLLGAALEWRQRLARRWTLRGHLSWQDWTWKLGPVYRHYADPTPALVDGNYDGQPVAGQSLVPGAGPLYLTSNWSFDLSGAVQLPAAFAAAIEVHGRQGFPLAYYRTIGRGDAGPIDLRLTGKVDAFRNDDLMTCDARLDKQIAAGSDLAVAVSLEALNLLAAGQVLRRETNLGVGRANYVDQVVMPRLLRLGLKLDFR
jgi:hypothetical protein